MVSMKIGYGLVTLMVLPFIYASTVDGNLDIAAGEPKVRDYRLELTHAYGNPDGIYKSNFLINGQSPGPIIEGDEGDWVNITVVNFLPVSITIHFHGILQKGTPWSDGVPGITQYPILSGDCYSYLFQLKDQYGFYWYHAHYRGYLTDGLYGPIYIKPNKERERPYDLIVKSKEELALIESLEKSPSYIIADDSFKLPMDDIMARMFHYGIDPLCILSILLNGKGRIYCHEYSTFHRLASKSKLDSLPQFDSMGCIRSEKTNGYHDFKLDNFGLESPGFSRRCESTSKENYVYFTNHSSWQYVNILNAGGQYTKAFSIDDHEFYVIAVDGVFIRPKLVHQLLIPVGSRYTVLLETNSSKHKNSKDPFAMRFAAIKTPQYIEALGYLIYGDNSTLSSVELQNIQQRNNINNGIKFQDLDGKLTEDNYDLVWPHETGPLSKVDQLNASKTGDHTFELYLNRTGVVEFSMFKDGTKLPAGFELSKPLLHMDFSDEENTFASFNGSLTDNIQEGDIVDIIINNFRTIDHPIHMHGHLFHLISYSETENFPYATVEEAAKNNYTNLNFENPPMFDIAYTPAKGHSVIRITANNPGIWLIHCHNLGHLLGGMGAVLFESIASIPKIPPLYLKQVHVEYNMQSDLGITELKNNTHDGSLQS